MKAFLQRHWRTIVVVLLGLAIVGLGNSYVSLHTRYIEAQEDYEWARQSLERSTKQLAEARSKLVPRQFESYAELAGWVTVWVAENQPIVIEFAGRNYVIIGNDELFSDYWDCDDIAEAMQKRAHIDGFLMSKCLVDADGCVYGVRVSDFQGHAGCMAIADNMFWYVEPLTGQITGIVARDAPLPSWWELAKMPEWDWKMPDVTIPRMPEVKLE